jgi:putative transcriptional regulator
MLVYKLDILAALKNNGYTTYRIKKEKILSESTLQKFRHKEGISWSNLDTLCSLLQCQPGDIIAYIPDDQQQNAKQ